MNIGLKKIGLIVALIFIIALVPGLSLLIGGVGAYYFTKKIPNRKLRDYAIALMMFSVLAIGINNADEVDTAQVAEIMESKQSAEVESRAEKAEQAEQEKEAAKKAAEAESKAQAEAEAAKKAQAESEQKNQEEAESKAQAEAAAKIEAERVALQTAPPPVFDGNTYVEVNGNIPLFTDADLSSTEAWEDYGALDYLGRVTVANAVLGVELMPAEERGDISDVYPTGWNQENYSVVSGGWLYNRSHLIGFQLTGENANARNLMTGTRWFNTEGMIPFENFVANYIETTENHVRYRVTPYFEGDNLLASGIYMEGMSIEDNGAALMFHIYVPNIQPNVHLDYATGLSWVDEPEEEVVEETPEPVIEEVPVVQEQNDISSIDTNGNGQVTIAEAKAAGFAMPIYSDHWLYAYMDDRDGDGMVGE